MKKSNLGNYIDLSIAAHSAGGPEKLKKALETNGARKGGTIVFVIWTAIEGGKIVYRKSPTIRKAVDAVVVEGKQFAKNTKINLKKALDRLNSTKHRSSKEPTDEKDEEKMRKR